MLKRKFGWAVALMALAAMSLAQSDPTKPVATVNGESITGMEYFRRMEFLPGFGRMVGSRFVESWPGYLALQQLINERLVLQVAKERNVMPKDADVQAELTRRTKESPTLIENLAKVGITRADLEHQIRVDIAEFNIITQGINVTDLEVEKHYKDNPSRFTIPRRYRLKLIACPEDRKSQVDTQLSGGAKFEDVAKALSTDPSSQNGGAIGEVPATAFAPAVLQALDAAKIGQATSWIQGSTGWFKFFIDDIKPQEKIPLDDKLRVQLRRTLMLDRGRVRNNIEKIMSDARKKAKIDVSQPGLSELIKDWQGSPTGD